MKFLASVILAIAMPIAAADRSGVQALDGNKNALGSLIGVPALTNYSDQPSTFLIFRNGYFVPMRFDGTFPVTFNGHDILMWTGPNCTGNVFLPASTNTVVGTHIVVYSRQSNSFYVPVGTRALANPVAETPVIQSVEAGFNDMNNTSGCYAVGGWMYPAWALTPFDVRQGLGWNVSGNPARVSGPITFQ